MKGKHYDSCIQATPNCPCNTCANDHGDDEYPFIKCCIYNRKNRCKDPCPYYVPETAEPEKSKAELLPCPFCGSLNPFMQEQYIEGTANRKHYRRECRVCHASFANWFRRRAKADAAWNRRAIGIVRCEECTKKETTNCALWYGDMQDGTSTRRYFCGSAFDGNFGCTKGHKKEEPQ